MRGGIAKCMVKVWGQEARSEPSDYERAIAVGVDSKRGWGYESMSGIRQANVEVNNAMS